MKITLSLTALLLSTTLAFAGGGEKGVIEAVEPVLEIPMEEPAKNYYVGIGYSCMQLTTDTPDEEYMANGLSLNLGYNMYENLAVEARYTTSIGDINYQRWNIDTDLDDSSMSNFGVYLKPKFNIGEFGMYGLVGYGTTTLDDGLDSFTENGFQYGIGTNFTFMEVDMFVDYRRLYDSEDFDSAANGQDVAVNSFTLGVNYLF